MFSFLKKNSHKILLVASLVLNALGGSGLISPPLAGVGSAVVNALNGAAK